MPPPLLGHLPQLASRPFEHQRRKRHRKKHVGDAHCAALVASFDRNTRRIAARCLARSNLLGRSAKDHNGGGDHRTVFPRRETAALFYIRDKTRPARRRSEVCSPRAASCDLPPVARELKQIHVPLPNVHVTSSGMEGHVRLV
jgi:hypothetical protein